ncbi:MAG: L-threonylcarbamoyladenylate synthase [Terracidiphilus sp.]
MRKTRRAWQKSYRKAPGARRLVRAAPNGDNKQVKTLHLMVDPARMETREAGEALERAAEILRAGGLVALPTETVYGLGANALDRAAVERIFAAKSRPAWDPIIVHIASEAMLEGLVEEVPAAARRLMEHFWPGPLTLLLPRTAAVPDAVTAGRPLVGVRMPAHPVALELIRRAGIPVAAPSANRFGHISPTTAQHVLDDLDGRIDAILDAGPSPRGVESTVLDPATTPMTIYRPGAVTEEQIREVAGPVELVRESGALRATPTEALPSPGVGIRHYAPRARVVLIESSLAELSACLQVAVKSEPGEQLGVMLPDGIAAPAAIAKERVFLWGRWSAPEELARRLYAGLRALDAAGCTVILCPLPAAEGIGAAIRDRLNKAGTKG